MLVCLENGEQRLTVINEFFGASPQARNSLILSHIYTAHNLHAATYSHMAINADKRPPHTPTENHQQLADVFVR